MDTKLLLVKSATLLYREGQLSTRSSNSSELVKNILTILKVPDSYTVNASEFGKDPISGVRETVRWMANNSADYTYDKSELLQRFRVNCGNDDSLFQAIYDGIEPEHGEDGLKKICLIYREALRTFVNQTKVKEILKKAYTQSWFQPSSVDWRHFVPTTIEELSPFANLDKHEGDTHPSLVTRIDFSDPESIQSAMIKTQEEMSADGILRTGLQGINRMLGRAGGFRRGEFVLTSGLQFNYKSGFMLDLFRHIARYNKPKLRDPERKPMLIRISLENEAGNDIVALYKALVEVEEGIPVDIKTIDPVQAANYVHEKMHENGYECKLFRFDPSDYTYYDLFDLITRFEADGYEVHCLQVDYLNMMSKRGCNQGPAGHEIRDLFRRVRNFTSPRGITFMTPHQLSSEAKMLTRGGVENLVREVAGKGYYDSCRVIDQEVDVEIHHHIVEVNGVYYLTFHRGKHRTQIGQTPARDLFTCYQFQEVGGIVDDILGPDMSLRTVGGSPMSKGGEGAWWDMG